MTAARKDSPSRLVALATALCLLMAAVAVGAKTAPLQRRVMPKPKYEKLTDRMNSDYIIVKLSEGIGQPDLVDRHFDRTGPEWAKLNGLLAASNKAAAVRPHFSQGRSALNDLRARGSARIGTQLPDLSLYYTLELNKSLDNPGKMKLIDDLNSLGIVEVAFFPPVPEPASVEDVQLTPLWESQQYYLQPAPVGLDAYYAWSLGNKGAGVKVIDIEGNWIQTHEDLHGGTDNFHIAGSRINDPGWWNHGTAVLGEIAADSNSFGMTGIAFNVDLGTISIGSMSTADALTTAINNSDSGDVFLIELHAAGPHYNFETVNGQDGYVAMEYWQDTFDAILYASSLGRIVCEAAGNGKENYDDTGIYGNLFDPAFRWSGAVMIGASDSDHWPASFTNYGQRVDVHAFGTWDVYTLGYGDLYGTSDNDYYTGTFAGTSSASPIITGAVALLQELHKSTHGRVLYEDEMHALLTDFSTPQKPSSKHIGPLPDLRGSTDQILGVSFTADTTIGWAPLDVAFEATSGLSVDTWTWSFGDGGAASTQDAAHQYTQRGQFDVSIQIDAGGDVRSASRQKFVTVLADSLWADTVLVGDLADEVVVTINAANSVPLKEIKIPVEYAGTISLNYDSMSIVGCRTDYFEEAYQSNFTGDGRMTFRLISSLGLTSPELEPGVGPVLKIFFSHGGVPSAGQTTPIILDGYGTSYMPTFNGSVIDFAPWTFEGAVTLPNCCQGIRGNINDDPEQIIDISDLVYLVQYMFSEGPEPPCMKEANVNGDIFEQIAIDDLVYLVAYMFSEGPDPAICF